MQPGAGPPPKLVAQNEPNNNWVRSEQVRQLYEAMPAALALSLAVGLVLVVGLWGAVPHAFLGGWLLAHLVVSGSRLGLAWAYRRRAPSPTESSRWLRHFLYGALLAGGVWGTAGGLLFPGGNALRLLLLAMTLAGISAGAVISMAAFCPATLTFLAPALIPFLVRSLVADFALAKPMAGMTALFLVAMGLMSYRVSQSLRNNIRLRLEATRRQQALFIYQAVFEQSRDAIVLVSRDRFRYGNQAALELFRLANIDTLCSYHPVDLSPVYQPDGQLSWQAANSHIEEAFTQGQAFFEWHHQRTDGTDFPAEVLLSRIDLSDNTLLQGIIRDISEQKALEAQLAHQAFHDPLTGLPNRVLLETRLSRALERFRSSPDWIALLFLDLDRFKEINDNLGHTIGDHLLQALAERLSKLMRGEDTLARLGGDEFVICLKRVTGADDALAAAQRIRAAAAQPLELAGHRVQSTCSIGISLYPRDSTTVEELLSHADSALYRAKAVGGNRVCSYTKEAAPT